jgi:hypothetical protein
MHQKGVTLLRCKAHKGGTSRQTSLSTAVERLDGNKYAVDKEKPKTLRMSRLVIWLTAIP